MKTSHLLLALALAAVCGCAPRQQAAVPESPEDRPGRAETAAAGRELTHAETLAWIGEQQAWRRARKTRPIWARAVADDEIGKEFQTADVAIEKAREGAWLCVGVANEPWFQSHDKIEAKYDLVRSESKQFAFDNEPHEYHLFQPKSGVSNWAARVAGPGIAGFSIRPGYDPELTLHSPAGGYVVKGDVADPYQAKPDDVWLVQERLFESTYELSAEDPLPPDGSGDDGSP